jgi:hypothetical protein
MTEESLYTKKGTLRKRKPKVKVEYFTLENQNAILKYRTLKNTLEKDKLYNEKIHDALYKLVENIIHSFGFYYTEVDNLEDLKYEVISFLLQKIHLYDESKGKAFSYFGTITKRYLISYCQKNYKKIIEKQALHRVDNNINTVDSLILEIPSPELDRASIIDELIENIEKDFVSIFDKEDELKAADAILEILKRHENIDISNKKALFVYVKEIADVKSTSISSAISKLKVIYKNILNRRIEKDDF